MTGIEREFILRQSEQHSQLDRIKSSVLIGSMYKSGANRRGIQIQIVTEDGKIHVSITFITLSNYAWASTILVLFTIEFLWVWGCAVDKYYVFTIIARCGLVKKSSFIIVSKILLFVGIKSWYNKFFCLPPRSIIMQGTTIRPLSQISEQFRSPNFAAGYVPAVPCMVLERVW